MAVKPSALSDIRQETVDFVKTAIQGYCNQNGLLIQTLGGNKGFPQRKVPTNQLHCVSLVKERCSWEYPDLQRTGHFYSGAMIVVREMPDEHGPDYVEVMFAPNHYDNTLRDLLSFPHFDLTFTQDELATQEKWPGIIMAIHEKIRLAMEEEDLALEKYRKS
jgi:hypothetical protein